MSYEARSRWTGQGNPMCELERRQRFGPIQPMPVEGLFARLLRLLARAYCSDAARKEP